MPGEDTRHSRLYWRLASDHPEVWCSPVLLGTYMLALATAEQAYPHPAQRPATCQPKQWRQLVAEGLVIEQPGGYTVRGLAAERQERSERGRRNALARQWQGSG